MSLARVRLFLFGDLKYLGARAKEDALQFKYVTFASDDDA